MTTPETEQMIRALLDEIRASLQKVEELGSLLLSEAGRPREVEDGNTEDQRT